MPWRLRGQSFDQPIAGLAGRAVVVAEAMRNRLSRPCQTSISCGAIQAPIWLPNGREAKEARDSPLLMRSASPRVAICLARPYQGNSRFTPGWVAID